MQTDKQMVYCMCVYSTHTHILLFSHVVEILPLSTTWMNLEGILLSEVSQTEKQAMYDFTYMWNLKSKTNEQTKQK